ncbi:PP2C-like domain-containing protein CG9801 isoform X2 [Coccinella septempunctata]|uniref:PP2C-like domain-containing protein CG9801 isoform X2 n=1 Tax=Coccinella septempunctata TaxID=41139 RepID=UPI001D0893E6|nr:PP2C-like domain-containing protein CG9801 isoform X2 [Coccinella septempunctata]
MPSLRKRVSTYFRQLSFHNEPRQKKHNINENAFITKYLQGHICVKDGPPIIYGKNPTDLPNYELAKYETGYETIISCYSGPHGGLTTVKRVEKHLSIPDTDDFDFIDTQIENGSSSSQSGSNDDAKLPKEWNKKNDYVFGISDSLYDTNLVTKVKNGDPIADCFGVISRKDSVILAVADGVNWGEKACIAAKSAIHGCLHYLNKTIFNDTKLFENLVVLSDQQATSPTIAEPLTHISNTREVFICLLRAFNCAHDLILENNGMLTTLTVAIVLPLNQEGAEPKSEEQKYVCCVCNVGDTLAYIYSGRYGIRELTKGSHDITSNRDMRDALGALGPVDGINPELSNLTLSITTLNQGDIVMVASDGLTDNFDPSVCKFTVNTTKIQSGDNKASSKRAQTVEKPPSTLNNTSSYRPIKPPRRSQLSRGDRADSEESKSSKKSEDSISSVNHLPDEKTRKGPNNDENLMDNPLIAHFVKQNSVDETDRRANGPQSSSINNTGKQSSSSQGSKNSQAVNPANRKPQQNYNFLRSKTTIDFHSTTKKPILRNEEGIPYVTPMQRYELQLLLMEDILKHGISGQEPPCTTSKKLCENLVNFTISITAAKRRTLEDMDLYFDNRDGVSVEISPMEKKQRRKKGLERVLNLPGKLDHVTVVACNVAHLPVNIKE